jgi:ferrous iron transport protein A
MDSHRDWICVPPPLTAGEALAGATGVQSLAQLHKGARGVVSEVLESSADDAQGLMLARRLIELGFVPGERFEIIGEVRPGGDPIAIRVGSSIFALRRREARAVLVQLDGAERVAGVAP